ncbi:MAG: iron export ABC transporter permease subunit FetB [Deltaproteobacteria bacterium]|nr:iron export ABC transporter permease subunit FetB [Candidatus Anaeroferrophillus wilburensis]MBN2887722.1 iron export ABC transporter permease subunit FetB [Deltaproteobacteria bacterium]
MKVVPLSPFDLSLAAVLILALAILSWPLKLQLGKQLLVGGLRTTVQLLLIGFILKWLFASANPGWLALMAMVMLLAAGREVMRRQQRRLAGWWGFGVGTISLFLSSFSIALFALTMVISIHPWYEPQYAIPLLGMLLGNTMNGISLGLDRLIQTVWQQRQVIEARLLLGEPWSQAVGDVRRDSIRSGLTPVINAMMAAGLVSLPGMMTGQILAGSPPVEAVKYQILIMFLISAGSGFGTLAAVSLAARRLFDHRHRLRLERLTTR